MHLDTHTIKLEDEQGEPNVLALIDAEGMLYVWKECSILGRALFRLMSKSLIDTNDRDFVFSFKWFSFSEENQFTPQCELHED